MNVTTFATEAPVRKRSSFPLASSFSGLKKIISPSKIIFLVLAVLAAVGIYSIFFSKNGSTGASTNVLPLSQKFEVVGMTKDGKTTNGNIGISVTGAYKSDSLLVQGQTVKARNGKTFLVVNMELTNPYNVPLYVQPVDFYRLESAGKQFAPTAHQGNVEIRPQSTKTSNVGFVVLGSDKKFKVQIGDLNGQKHVLEFTLNDK